MSCGDRVVVHMPLCRAFLVLVLAVLVVALLATVLVRGKSPSPLKPKPYTHSRHETQQPKALYPQFSSNSIQVLPSFLGATEPRRICIRTARSKTVNYMQTSSQINPAPYTLNTDKQLDINPLTLYKLVASFAAEHRQP